MQAPFPDNGVRRKKLRSNRSNYADLVSAAAAGLNLVAEPGTAVIGIIRESA